MWLFGKRTARQREIRRTRTEREGVWYRRLLGRFEAWSLTLTGVAVVVSSVIINLGGEPLSVRSGQTLARAIASRVEFQLVDERQTALMRDRARESAPYYYVLDVSLLDGIRGRLLSALTLAQTHAADGEALKRAAAESRLSLDDAAIDELVRIAGQPESEQFRRQVDQVVRTLVSTPLVEYSERVGQRLAVEAMLIDPRGESERVIPVPVNRLRFNNNVENVNEVAAEAARAMSQPLRSAVANSLAALLTEGGTVPARPIYRFNMDRSTRAQQDAVARVETQMLTYKPGALLADAGLVDEKEVALLRAERDAFAEAEREEIGGWRKRVLAAAGYSVLALLIVFGLSSYLSRYQRRVFNNPFRQTVATCVLLLMLAAARTVSVWTDAPPHLAVAFQGFAAAMLAIVYTRGSVFAICAALALLITLATRQDVSFAVVLIAVSGTLIVGLTDVRNRGKIVMVGFAAAVVALATTLAAGLVARQTIEFALGDALWASLSALLAAFVVEGILPGIERLFKFSTGMTLLEWCDANKPLLRTMAAEAPGTYNHSLLVGALAEAAAEAIGANGLLCRAGAYYHDIGKINKPDYFVENQTHGASRHERLSPAMSLLIIVGHVKDGIEMAKEYGLPATLRPFIAEHHGTTLVEYFYHAANKARKPDDPEVQAAQFRYPGPKPQSRETAIVMLCDGVEGAVRAMAEPTPTRIEDVVSEIIRKRLMDGQFDECDLTFRELAIIEKSLVKSLSALYHGRIAYPESEEKEKEREREKKEERERESSRDGREPREKEPARRPTEARNVPGG